MGSKTEIEWTDHTFNPWWGCVKVSAGCANCYAARWAHRYGLEIWGKDAPRRFFSDKHWEEPLAWNRKAEKEGVRRRVFCGSMCDVFELNLDIRMGDARWQLYKRIEQTPMLDWLLLTKRPENILDFVPELWKHGGWPANAWVGTTAENQDAADERVPILLSVPAPVRFLSCEPLLELIDMSKLGTHWLGPASQGQGMNSGIDWVIVGGESGPGARPMDPAWARSVRDQCQAARVPFFFKQWGEYVTLPQARELGVKMSVVDAMNANALGGGFVRVGKKRAGCELDGREWKELPKI